MSINLYPIFKRVKWNWKKVQHNLLTVNVDKYSLTNINWRSADCLLDEFNVSAKALQDVFKSPIR